MIQDLKELLEILSVKVILTVFDVPILNESVEVCVLIVDSIFQRWPH